MRVYTLGINAVYHDCAAALIEDGRVVAAAEDERFTHVKHGKRPVPFTTWQLPFHAIDYCLREAGVGMADVDHVAYSFRPQLFAGSDPRLDPLFLQYVTSAPRPLADGAPPPSFPMAPPPISTTVSAACGRTARRTSGITSSTTSRTKRAPSFPRPSRSARCSPWMGAASVRPRAMACIAAAATTASSRSTCRIRSGFSTSA